MWQTTYGMIIRHTKNNPDRLYKRRLRRERLVMLQHQKMNRRLEAYYAKEKNRERN